MPQYLFRLSYAPESLAAQMKDPADRLKTVAMKVVDAIAGKYLGGGYSFGDYDVMLLIEAPDDESVAAVRMALLAGGGVKSVDMTRLYSGDQWVSALSKANDVANTYQAKK